jgi:very-short-patch-repair endonuclease
MDGVLPITGLARTVVDLSSTDISDTRLRVVAAKPIVGLPAGDLEIQFLEWLVARGFPLPGLNQRLDLNGRAIYPDCMWRRERVIAEIDSKKHHDNWAQRTRDMARHTALAALDWRTVYVTKAALAESYALERDLKRALSRVTANG